LSEKYEALLHIVS